ncbi:hypothetical protein V6N11_051697 [Hibiscus sabdariffa]|uniref:Retrotransposon Copia-like N-terminal domain-containing protein n=1 Tax=Hibiscus sabdariffa TaxID=183260 RepID=A0ABR2U859_9ROSI
MQRKTILPYDITSSDNPGSLITQIQLKGENYDEWARSLRTALRARRKLERARTISRGKEEHIEVMSFVVQAGLKSRWRGEGKDNDRPRGTARGYGQNKGRQQFVNSGSKGRGGVKANVVQASTKKVVGCPVGLPNGNQIAATKEGIMVFDNKLTLNHVLYVPSLMCNLISLSQLLDETKCGAQFTDNFCVIQDCTSRMLLVSVNKEGALLLSYDGDYNDDENEWTKFL